MNNKQMLAGLIGIVALWLVYCIKFVLPIAKIKREHPEISATNPPNAVVGGLSGTIMLLVILTVTVVAVVMLRGKH